MLRFNLVDRDLRNGWWEPEDSGEVSLKILLLFTDNLSSRRVLLSTHHYLILGRNGRLSTSGILATFFLLLSARYV